MASQPAGKSDDSLGPKIRNLGTVPVYNCHVYLSQPDGSGQLTARGATLPEIQATGRTEREVLQNVVRAFKETIGRYMAAGQTIPWVDPPLPAVAGERPRWVPVHF